MTGFWGKYKGAAVFLQEDEENVTVPHIFLSTRELGVGLSSYKQEGIVRKKRKGEHHEFVYQLGY